MGALSIRSQTAPAALFDNLEDDVPIGEIPDSYPTLDRGDVLAVPGWTPWRLQAQEASVLFALTDRPVHQALGLWREARA